MIRIICIGRIKKEWKPLQEEFLKRISVFRKIEVIEAKEREVKKIEKYFKGFVVFLDESGKEMRSEEFAYFINSQQKISFLIGGKKGIPERFCRKANLKLSLSKMTFSHQLARIVLLEQIYRGFCIINNLPYSR